LKKQLRYLIPLLLLPLTVQAGSEPEKQVDVVYKYTAATADLPWIPEGYETIDWAAYAEAYYERIFSDPTFFYEDKGLYHTEKTRLGIVTHVGEEPTKDNVEAMTLITLLLSNASLESSFPKSEMERLATKIEGYYSLDQGENVFLNYLDKYSRDMTFYEQVYPGLLYFMLMDRIDPTENSDRLLEQIATGWHDVVMDLGGGERHVDFAYTGYDFAKREPYHDGTHLEPDAAAGVALLEYYAFQKFQDRKYMKAAQYCMDYLDHFESHYGTHLLYFYTPYLAARLNHEEGFKYDVAWHMEVAYEPTADNWGWLSPNHFATGLVGSRTEYGGTAYTYDSIMGLTALIPLLKYDARYANEIGRSILHASYQLGEQAKLRSRSKDEPLRTESIKAQGAIGYLGSMLKTTNVDGVLQVDVNLGDFYQDHLDNPTFLLFNPFDEEVRIEYDIQSDEVVGLYDLVTKDFLTLNVQNKTEITIPGNQSVVLIELPIEEGDNRYKLDRKVEKEAPQGPDASVRFLNLKENEILSTDKDIELEMLFRGTRLNTLAILLDGKELFKNVSYEEPFILELKDIEPGYHLLQAKMVTKSGTEDSAYVQVFVEKEENGYFVAEAETVQQWEGISPVMEVDFSQIPILELHLSHYAQPWSLELVDVASGQTYPLRTDSVEAGQLNINLESVVEDDIIHLFGTHEIQFRYNSDLPVELVRVYHEGFTPLTSREWAYALMPQRMIHFPAGKSGQLNYRHGKAVLNQGVSKTDWFEIKLDKNPYLTLKVDETIGTWSLLAYLEGEEGPKYLQYSTDEVGTFTYDLAGFWDVMQNEPHNVQFWISADGEAETHTYLDYLRLAYRPGYVRLGISGFVFIATIIVMFVEMRRES